MSFGYVSLAMFHLTNETYIYIYICIHEGEHEFGMQRGLKLGIVTWELYENPR